MKQRILWSLLALWLVGATGCLAANYDKLWEQARQYEEKDLPKSAYKIVEQIAAKAEREQKKGQQMAALLYGSVLRQKVVPDSFYTDMLRLERLKRQTNYEVQLAVLASVLGGLYENNSGRNRNYNDRTDAPSDSLREWSRAQFLKSAAENYRLSLAHPEILAEARADDYQPFVEKGKDDGYFSGDLLNVVGRWAAEASEAFSEERDHASQCAFYARMLSVYRQKGNREAELLLMLDSIRTNPGQEDAWRWNTGEKLTDERQEQIALASDEYKTYRRMLDRFGDLPLAAEIYLAMMELNVTPKQKVAWVDEGMARYPGYSRVKALENRKADLECPSLTMQAFQQLYPGQVFECQVTHRNVAGAELQWWALPTDILRDSTSLRDNSQALRAYALAHGRKVRTDRLVWPEAEAYEEKSDTLRLTGPEKGFYVALLKPYGEDTIRKDLAQPVYVSRLHIVTTQIVGNRVLCRVVDAATGKPVAGATVVGVGKPEMMSRATTDAAGEAFFSIPGNKGYWWTVNFYAYKGDDFYWDIKHNYLVRNRSGADDMETAVKKREQIYTDRSVYRPGQTVYVGGLASVMSAGEEHVRAGVKMKLTLMDSHGKSVGEREVESDEMGKFAADFVLPSEGAEGNYSLRSENGWVSFRVESYKRPVFEVKLDELTQRYHAGDTLRWQGTALTYTGVPVRRARVTAVTSLSHGLWRNGSAGPEEPLDTVYTDDEGRFTISVRVSDIRPMPWEWGLRQNVKVYVLNAAGETHEAQASFPLSKDGLNLTVRAEDY
ncbi:MAG: MG2 domain-containing protein [Paraprevotella sp.]|nr:MG2 domain-containing protein [Paraprevotella sp.]